MYRASKILNHNAVLAVSSEDRQEYLILGKGVGFGKKVTQSVDAGEHGAVYSLQKTTKRGDAKALVQSISPEFLEIADLVLQEARKEFGEINNDILFPMADHLEFAVKRIRNHEAISNPLTADIRLLFYAEYKVALCIVPILRNRMGVQMNEDEVGYIALHVHTAIEKEEVSQAMLMAEAVRMCVSFVEEETGKKMDVMSLSYNRLMNHIRYMIARASAGEELKVNMNDYIKIKFPEAFQLSEVICRRIEKELKCSLRDVEIGYLAMHIERVRDAEQEL